MHKRPLGPQYPGGRQQHQDARSRPNLRLTGVHWAVQNALPLLPEAQAAPVSLNKLLLAQVVARIRPLSEREVAAGDTAIAQVSVEDPNSAVVRGRPPKLAPSFLFFVT